MAFFPLLVLALALASVIAGGTTENCISASECVELRSYLERLLNGTRGAEESKESSVSRLASHLGACLSSTLLDTWSRYIITPLSGAGRSIKCKTDDTDRQADDSNVTTTPPTTAATSRASATPARTPTTSSTARSAQTTSTSRPITSSMLDVEVITAPRPTTRGVTVVTIRPLVTSRSAPSPSTTTTTPPTSPPLFGPNRIVMDTCRAGVTIGHAYAFAPLSQVGRVIRYRLRKPRADDGQIDAGAFFQVTPLGDISVRRRPTRGGRYRLRVSVEDQSGRVLDEHVIDVVCPLKRSIRLYSD